MTVMPEPYIGPLAAKSTPALVMLGLNPGAPAPTFQSIDGIYTQRVRETSYGEVRSGRVKVASDTSRSSRWAV
ncbi:hypothetical protein SAMN04488242_0398 [Tessaracoccus oleiagri]|uniref:Uncharacterized protein n=2 Tax=Tessaracoccus oleiagri TaxID=686624 RepID=A0A1G9HLS3_9ACTN|nr:hypothetical protein SAMN04488242_0398 [Tessaracoccus oleiagri]